jgi:hypothetical protein
VQDEIKNKLLALALDRLRVCLLEWHQEAGRQTVAWGDCLASARPHAMQG